MANYGLTARFVEQRSKTTIFVIDVVGKTQAKRISMGGVNP